MDERRENAMSRQLFLKAVLVAAVFASVAGSVGVADAQKYPSHPITMIVAWGAGGGTDAVARTQASGSSASERSP